MLRAHAADVAWPEEDRGVERTVRLGIFDCGQETLFPVITGGGFDSGVPDGILQRWAALLTELALGGTAGLPGATAGLSSSVSASGPGRFAACATPQETSLSHRRFAAALESHRTGRTAALPSP